MSDLSLKLRELELNMEKRKKKENLLKSLPGVDKILLLSSSEPSLENVGKSLLTRSIRTVIQDLRASIIDCNGEMDEDRLLEANIIEQVKKLTRQTLAPKLVRTVNATGVVIHTNLGRSLLCDDALDDIVALSRRYSNLEFDLSTGKRGSRYSAVEDILCELSGAEAAIVVNNNAGAVFIALNTLAKNKKVIVSRGELVEIGGSFRIPDIMRESGCILSEVGTTNRTHVKDYENAIDDDTKLFLKVHKSNYSIEGFTAEVSLQDLSELAQKNDIPVMEDLGSGTLIDLSRYGLRKEPTIQNSVASGVDIVTFSGDKLLGGPQAGIIVGKKDPIEKIKKNPINRALRIDKMTLAALESTLRIYRDEERAVNSIPTLLMLTTSLEIIKKRAEKLKAIIENINKARIKIKYMNRSSRVGGGALPLQQLPSVCLGVKIDNLSANRIEKFMHKNRPPIIGRIEKDFFIMDLRTIQDEELEIIHDAFSRLSHPKGDK